ncbi:hypothetical protein D8O27_06785 [Burkholderia mallei]|uniref:Uncharacterized protein n=3 Tax=pseudomallei group TaxID=111527 RepID=A0AAX1X8X6_BURML|nr:hypothetical protein BURPS1106A_1293 [Burkholderia pseudomallei 1106a]ARK47910.1 hypothetical protein BOC35_16190 [Burkholderia pseudomallei]EBA44799.1 hypothetical protein BURPS305_7999 [Burkholderia pseudomallei 305]EDO93900.1 hypothetical protein BURPSPAST_A0894 [Burkholderia pseudomallei Pasteur 52237]EDU08773.1 hypothetical protein BURPS1655_K0046 [Burkholderia pseudomallei 1655]EEC37003.1 conserved hypothetical protein [Burkholderia pseudomallei 576]EEH28501.1 conserved hypothetical 
MLAPLEFLHDFIEQRHGRSFSFVVGTPCADEAGTAAARPGHMGRGVFFMPFQRLARRPAPSGDANRALE